MRKAMLASFVVLAGVAGTLAQDPPAIRRQAGAFGSRYGGEPRGQASRSVPSPPIEVGIPHLVRDLNETVSQPFGRGGGQLLRRGSPHRIPAFWRGCKMTNGYRVPKGVLALFVLGIGLTESKAVARDLGFEERVAAQRAIEEVYWRHRIWPRENPAPKPPLSVVLPDDAIRAKVEDYLRKSNALETWWQRPITVEQLQAELDRMARDTRDAEMLRELHAALGNDAFLIAETLARPTLVERLIRNWYAADERFHGAVKQEAMRALAGTPSVAEMKALGGEYIEQTFARRGEVAEATASLREDGVVELEAEEWQRWTAELAQRFGTTWESIPLQRLSGLQEEADRFFVTAVLSLDTEQATIASVVWPKRSFDAWWSEERFRTSVEVEAQAGGYEAAAPTGGRCTGDTWEWRYYGPAPRRLHTAVWTGTEMIVWGGMNSTSRPPSGGRYDPATDTWTPTSTGANVPAARDAHTAVWTGTVMIVWGGEISGTETLNTGGRYDPSTDTWAPTSTGMNVPSERLDHTAVWTGTEMIVWGGWDMTSPTRVNTGGRYNPSTDTWAATSTGANVPSARSNHTAVWTGTEVIAWGGYDGSAFLKTGGRYNPTTNSWMATAAGLSAPSIRDGHTAVWTGTEMIVWGGSATSLLNTGGRYDPATNTWTATSTDPGVPDARSGHTVVWTGTRMIVWGGSTTSGGLLNTGGRYNPATNTWTATSTGANVPEVRKEHTAVWTGTEMIAWGGSYALFAGLNNGGRYDPATDAWTATSTGNVPAAQQSHTAVWTGTEMIAWGGTLENSFKNTGGRYDPATDAWTATSTGANVPQERSSHTAVWTGTEMIVWGGLVPGNVHVKTGGRYNPMTDVWTTTTTDAPGPRAQHTAVWTGTRMVVWGGFFNGFPVDTGGRYDPLTDTWFATSTGANVPAARRNHTAVWTGTRMVVWGGSVTGGQSNTGGRYDPATNTWATTSTGTNVPEARSDHTAEWTGTRMIVWGGSATSGLSNTGGRYDPAANTWATTSTGANVPTARWNHTVAWTGTQMVVWGGIGTSDLLNTGGRYDPATDSWMETSTGANVPPAVRFHTAVWTGSQMIVWGGVPTDLDLGLYCADGCSPLPDGDFDGLGDACDACPGDPLNDGDFDGVCGAVDCAVSDGAIWATPGEVQGVLLGADKETLGFSSPIELGGLSGSVRYDTIRSSSPPDFDAAGICIETDDGADLVAVDTEVPGQGVVFYYLIRAENDCGVGAVGNATSGPRPPARDCP